MGAAKEAGKGAGSKIIKKIFKLLKKSGVGKEQIKNLTENVTKVLEKIKEIDPKAVNSVFETIGKVKPESIDSALEKLGKLDPDAANALVKKVTEKLGSINMDSINKLVGKISSAAEMITENQGLMQTALKAVVLNPILQGINCLLSVGILITGILTVKELKKITQELKDIKNELITANQKTDEIILILNTQIELSRQIAEGVNQIGYLVGYDGKQDNEINDRNIAKVKSRYQDKRYKESVSYSNACLEFRKSNIFYYRGLSLYELGYYFAAIENFTKAMELDPNNTKYLYWRGLSFLHLSFTEAAKQDFKKILLLEKMWPQLEAHLYLVNKEYGNAQRKYLNIIRAQNFVGNVKPEIKNYELYYVLGISRIGLEEYENANIAFSLAQHLAVSINKKTEFMLMQNALQKEQYEITDNERQCMQACLRLNMVTTKINFEGREEGISLQHHRGDAFLLERFYRVFRNNQLDARDANILYFLFEKCLKLDLLIEAMYFCKFAADLGNPSAKERIIECHKILNDETVFESFVDWNFVVNIIRDSFINPQMTVDQKNKSLAKYYAGIILYRGLFEKSKHLELAITYFNEIENNNLLAKVMVGYDYQFRKKDNVTAQQYYEQARQLPLAKYYLSYILYERKDVARDLNQAFQYYQGAYENGILIAYINFAKNFYHGIETPTNYSFALKLFEMLSEQGSDSEACYYKARCYYLAQGVDRDEKKAKEILLEVANKQNVNVAPNKGIARAITALSAIFTSENTSVAKQWKEKIKTQPLSMRKASITCNGNFAIQVYQDGENLSYRIGQSIAEKLIWRGATSIILNAKNPSVAMNNNKVCLVGQNLNNQLFYMIGRLNQGNGNIVWGDIIRLGITLSNNSDASVVAMHSEDNSVMLVFTEGDSNYYGIGELQNDDTIQWKKRNGYSFNLYNMWRIGSLKSIAMFQYDGRKLVTMFTESKYGEIAYETGVLRDNKIIWQKNNFIRDDVSYSDCYSPTICVSGEKIYLAFTGTKDINQDSLLWRMTGTFRINFEEDEKFTAKIDWDKNLHVYDLGNLPKIACLSRDKIIELHEENGELSSRQLQL